MSRPPALAYLSIQIIHPHLSQSSLASRWPWPSFTLSDGPSSFLPGSLCFEETPSPSALAFSPPSPSHLKLLVHVTPGWLSWSPITWDPTSHTYPHYFSKPYQLYWNHHFCDGMSARPQQPNLHDGKDHIGDTHFCISSALKIAEFNQ